MSAKIKAAAVIARSPPESAASAVIFLPGGCTAISMPVSASEPGFVCHIFAAPPGKSRANTSARKPLRPLPNVTLNWACELLLDCGDRFEQGLAGAGEVLQLRA